MGSLAKGFLLLLLLCFLRKGEAPGYEMASTCKSLECPSYEVVHHQKGLEIRSYRNAMWMSTHPINSSSYKEAVGIGFSTLFAYIQGKNHEGVKIDMTAPVLVDVLPSTGPFCNSSFVVYFYVPRKYQTGPPLSDQVTPKRWPKNQYAAVRRFGGFMDDSNVPLQASALKKGIKGTPWESAVATGGKGPSIYSVAGYNSPYESENRVNEVMLLFHKY